MKRRTLAAKPRCPLQIVSPPEQEHHLATQNDSDSPFGLDQLADEEWAHRLCELPDQPWKRPRVPVELYDLSADPTEQNNLGASSRHVDIRKRLSLLLETGNPAERSSRSRSHR